MNWHVPAGTTGSGPETVVITPASAGWGFTGLTVVELPPGGSYDCPTGDCEVLVLPLAGGAVLDTTAGGAQLKGRPAVFAGPSDCAYVPRDARLSLTTAAGGRFALASAKAGRRFPFRYLTGDEVRVELRGAGSCSRQVSNFATPDVLDADRLIACEVLTPGGNWSSYPPHKHDEEAPGESVLEEIYYFEVSAGPGGRPPSPPPAGHGPAGPGLAYLRVYGTPQRHADVLAEVGTGDVVLIPHGWHGPAMAAPGYDLYYLNVMAGPGKREWLIRDDPHHAWVRGTWATQPVDPRLPATGRM